MPRWLRVVRRSAAAALVVACTAPAPGACAASGGETGARAQLRFVDASDQRVVFTFGLAGGGGFGAPAFVLAAADAPDAGLTLRLEGVSRVNADGTPSYDGPDDLRPGGAILREVRFRDESGGAMRWDLAVASGACPRVRARTYTGSTTFPRAQLVLFFSGESAITVESPTSPYAGTAITVSGLGFTPGRAVTLSVEGALVHTTTADPAGDVNSAFFLPPLAPGAHALVAADGAGHRTATSFSVAVRP